MTTLNQVLRTVARCVLPAVTAAALLGSTAHAAVPGITADPATHVFNLVASANRISQPDGQMIYTWGYGCAACRHGRPPRERLARSCSQPLP